MVHTLDKLRRLAAGDPKAARQLVASLLDGDAQELEDLLTHLAAPDEGRLRQLVANTARQRADREKVVPHLLRWLYNESDEFARSAIEAALEGIDVSQQRHDRSLDPPDLVQTYRYVAGRLCHKVRNALPAPMKYLRRIEDLARQRSESSDSAIVNAVQQLRESLRMMSRLVEFDIEDKYFEWRPVHLVQWLDMAGRKYNTRNEPITVELGHLSGEQEVIIRANDYLLETIFWNLWKNSREAVDGPCRVKVTISIESGRVLLLVTDNGEGLPEKLVGFAFEDRVSTYGNGRGRGLLEVADAVQRLFGRVRVVNLGNGGHRIQISLPLERT